MHQAGKQGHLRYDQMARLEIHYHLAFALPALISAQAHFVLEERQL